MAIIKVRAKRRVRYNRVLLVPNNVYDFDERHLARYVNDVEVIISPPKKDKPVKYSYDSYTKAEIVEMLNAKGIQATIRLKKDELINLLKNNGKS